VFPEAARGHVQSTKISAIGAVLSRDVTRSPGYGSAILGESVHRSVCQIQLWVLTCVFIVALHLRSNISANYCNIHGFGLGPVTALLIYIFQLVHVIFTYLFMRWLSFWCYDVSGFDVIWVLDR